MPLYEWECQNDVCGKRIEIFLKHIIKDEEKIIKCPHCGTKAELQQYSFHWHDNEKGWYIQDKGFNSDSPEYNFNLKKQKEKEAKENAKV